MLKFALPALVALSLLALSTTSASAASATLSVDPASATANPNDTFTLTLKVNSDVALGGVQTNIIFDRQILQIQDVAPAAPWQSALFLVGQAPQTKQDAIDQANNSTGKLLGVATFFSAGAGSVPAGTSDFVTVTMKAVAGGTSPVSFTPEPLFLVRATDTDQNVVPLTTTAGSVTVSGATVSPTPEGQTPSPSPSPSPTGAPTPTPTPGLPVEASISVTPASLAVRPGTEFTISLTQQTNLDVSGAGVTVTFDPALLEFISASRGPAYSAGSVVYGLVPPGATPQPLSEKIVTANSTGRLDKLTVFLSPPAKVAAGQAEMVVIKFKSRAGAAGTSAITLTDAEVINTEGDNVGVTVSNGQIEVSANAAALPATGGAPVGSGAGAGWLLALAGLLALLTGGSAMLASRRGAGR